MTGAKIAFFILFFNVHSFFEKERERESMSMGGAERGTQNPKQAPGFELSAQSRIRGQNS